MQPRPQRRRHAHPGPGLLLLVALVCLVASACGGSGDDGAATAPSTMAAASAATTAATQACADAQALKASVARLDQLDPPEAGKAGVHAAVQDTRGRLDTLKASADSRWRGQIDELDRAISAFQTTVVGLDAERLLADLPTIVSDLERVDRAWSALEGEIDRTCPTP
jgi:hypothetical protein